MMCCCLLLAAGCWPAERSGVTVARVVCGRMRKKLQRGRGAEGQRDERV